MCCLAGDLGQLHLRQELAGRDRGLRRCVVIIIITMFIMNINVKLVRLSVFVSLSLLLVYA